MVDAQRQPGFDTPGPKSPGSAVPGSRQPNESAEGIVSVTQTGVAIDATGTTTIGDPTGRAGRVVAVVVTPTAADFDFNIEAGGSDIFATEQSPSAAAEERFVPAEEELAEFDGAAPEMVIDVSAASATGGATADVTVITAVEEQTSA